MTVKTITEIYAWIAKTPDGNEGIPAVGTPSGLVIPLVGGDLSRVESLRPQALQVLEEAGVSLKLVKFIERVELESFDAKEQDDAAG